MRQRPPTPPEPRPVPDAVAVSLFKGLPPERRQEIAREALAIVAKSLVDAHGGGSVRALLDAFEAHPMWPYLRGLPMAPLLPSEPDERPDEAAPAPSRPAVESRTTPRDEHAAKPAVPRRRKEKRRADDEAPADAAPATRPAGPAPAPARREPAPEPARESTPAPPPILAAPAPADPEAIVASIAGGLGERDPSALAELRAVVTVGGIDLARAAYRKTLEIEEAGGILRDGRRKTPGGVFFFLVKTRAGRELLGPPFSTMPLLRRAVSGGALAEPPPPNGTSGIPSSTSRERELLDTMMAFISRNPGLSEDEIRSRMGGDRVLVRATLDALREQGKVKTFGSRKAKTYSISG